MAKTIEQVKEHLNKYYLRCNQKVIESKSEIVRFNNRIRIELLLNVLDFIDSEETNA